MIRPLIPRGPCINCDEAAADFNPWICAGCAVSMHRDKAVEPAIDDVPMRCVFRYEGAVSALLKRAKNPLEPDLYDWLLAGVTDLPLGSVFVPIPTPWRRRFRRGGCHTTQLAQALAERTEGRVVHALRRRRHGNPQASLDAEQRKELPADTFKAARRLPHNPVVLVDDVATTGSTLRAALAVLRPICKEQDVPLSVFVVARVP